MKKNSLFVKALLSLAAGVLLAGNAAAQKQLPDVRVQTVKGRDYPVRDCLAKGVPVVLSFWGSTCKPCLQELDAISDNYDDWQEEAPFEVVAVSTDDARSSAKSAAMARGRNWPFTVLLDPNNDLKRAMNVTMMPTLFILDKNGRVVYSHIGYTPGSEEKILEIVKTLR